MQFHSRIIRYALVASVGVLAACDTSNLQTAPQARLEQLVPSLALELSTPTAGSGDLIAIAIANTSSAPIGAVQGVLRFNPAQLRFRGQVRDESSNEIMMVNTTDANSGEIVVGLLNPANITRSSALVFEVVGQGYASSVSFDVQAAGINGAMVQSVDARMAPGFVVNRNLQAPVAAAPMTISDWYEAMSPNHVAAEPGNIINGLKYGDATGDGVIDINDALYVVNVSVGGNEMIVGTDGTGPQGRVDAVVAGNVAPFNLDAPGYTGPDIGEAGDPNAPGVEANGTRLIDINDALAIVNEGVGQNQPVAGEVIPGRPVTPVSNRVIVNADITTSQTWTSNNIYELVGKVTVTNGATLTIQAGTRVEGARAIGNTGAYLVVARDGRMNAVGTAVQPITFTCTQKPAGPGGVPAAETPRFKGCWGGISVLGNASVNETGSLSSPIIAGRAATGGCREAAAEGSAGTYGGCNDDDNSGTYSYLVLDYPGFRFNAENELNGLALYGVGRGTTVDHIQVHAGLDDAIEMFGGTVNMKYLYMTATSDDALDYTFGWNGKTQFIITQHDPLDSDNAFENDNATTGFDSSPRATPAVYNVTLVGLRNNRAGVAESQNRGMLVRRGARPKYFNFHIEGFTNAFEFRDATTCTSFQTAGFLEFKNSTVAANASNGPTSGPCGTPATILAANGNSILASSPLLAPLSVIVPDYRPAAAFGTAATPPSDGFFMTSANYVGAVEAVNATKSNIPWYAGWTHGWQSAATP